MSTPQAARRTLADFLDWEARQPARWELVGGEPRMMAGGSQVHALIASNLIAFLRPALRSGPCRPTGSDLRIPIPDTGNLLYPDVTIDCGFFDPSALSASEPTVIFEILSRSTGWYDQTTKLRDYETVPSIRQYVCISQSEQLVTVWTKDERGLWGPAVDLGDDDAEVSIVRAGLRLPVSAIYDETGVRKGR